MEKRREDRRGGKTRSENIRFSVLLFHDKGWTLFALLFFG
jgi:hypothetical protein